MKSLRIRIITSIGLITVFALQVIWLNSTFSLIKKNIIEDCNRLFGEAALSEAISHLDEMPKGIKAFGAPRTSQDDDLPESTYLLESLRPFGVDININRLDSIYKNLLSKKHIESALYIDRLFLKNNIIIKTTQSQHIPMLGVVKTQIIPLRLDKSEGVQATILNPYYTIFKRMSLLILATAIMMVLVIGCIIYQIRIIAKQNKIAKVREDFSYAMIHDMKQPLCIITSCINLLQNKGMKDRPDIQKHYFNVVENESNRLLALTEKVLTISKLESHKLDIHKQTVDLAPLFNNLAERFATKSAKPIKFDIDLEVAEIKVDEEYFKEALCNLIDNAIKYSKESIEITIRSVDKEHHTLVKVRDNGIGIAKEDQALIFEKFERASAIGRTRKGGSTGFGLGLTYVQQITEAHGGRVIVNSIEGEFSEFILYIPKFEKNDDQTISR